MRFVVSLTAAALAALGLAACHTHPTISVTPATVDENEHVTVTGGGYSAGSQISVMQCPITADSFDDCATSAAQPVTVDDRGHFATQRQVFRSFDDGNGNPVDCSAPDSCVIASAYYETFDGLATAPIQLTAPSDAVTVAPDTGLVDGQEVTVSVQNWTAGSAKVAQCRGNAVDLSGCDSRTIQYPGTGSGDFTVTFTVHTVIQTSSGNSNCSPASCYILVDLGHGFTIFDGAVKERITFQQ